MAGSINVGDLSQNTTAFTAAAITSTLPITARITPEIVFGPKLPDQVISEAVGVTGPPAKFINIIVPRRNLDIIYEDLIEKEPPLPKTLAAKLAIENDDKPSYDAAIAGPEASL